MGMKSLLLRVLPTLWLESVEWVILAETEDTKDVEVDQRHIKQKWIVAIVAKWALKKWDTLSLQTALGTAVAVTN